MATQVSIPSPMRKYFNEAATVSAEGGTVGELLDNLTAQFPDFASRLYKPGTAGGAKVVNRNINIYVNDEDIRFNGNLAMPLKPGDNVSIITAVAGG